MTTNWIVFPGLAGTASRGSGDYDAAAHGMTPDADRTLCGITLVGGGRIIKNLRPGAAPTCRRCGKTWSN